MDIVGWKRTVELQKFGISKVVLFLVLFLPGDGSLNMEKMGSWGYFVASKKA